MLSQMSGTTLASHFGQAVLRWAGYPQNLSTSRLEIYKELRSNVKQDALYVQRYTARARMTGAGIVYAIYAENSLVNGGREHVVANHSYKDALRYLWQKENLLQKLYAADLNRCDLLTDETHIALADRKGIYRQTAERPSLEYKSPQPGTVLRLAIGRGVSNTQKTGRGLRL